MNPKATYEVELYPAQHDYLVRMVEKHGLPSVDKALRCLISFAEDRKDQEDEIFEQMRCRDC